MIDLKSKLRRGLLTHYFANPAARLYVRELALLLNVDPTNLSRELAKLEREGLFESEMRGKQKYYSLNRKYPLFKEVSTILQRTIGTIPTLSSALKRVAHIEEAYLYGSFAKRSADAASDIDVLIVGTPVATELALATSQLEKLLHREINYTVITAQELKRKLAQRDPFLTDIWSGKRIDLIAA